MQAVKKALAASKTYTNEVVVGGGAIKGKNCVIDSITDITVGTTVVGHTVTFKWTLDNGTVQTDSIDVMDGVDGEKGDTGLGIKSVAFDSSNHLIITYDDNTTEDAGVITLDVDQIADMNINTPQDGQILKYNQSTGKWENASGQTVDTNLVDLKDVNVSTLTDGQIIVWDATAGRWVNSSTLANKVDKETGKGLSTEDYTTSEKQKLGGIESNAQKNVIEGITVNGTSVSPDPNKVIALTVIDKAVNDLLNYYLKSDTYSKTEVDNIISAVKNSRFAVVNQLPTTDISTNTIYLVPKTVGTSTLNVRDEYINTDGTSAGWELIGDTEIDLSGYVTDDELATALADYTTTTNLTALLADKQDKLTAGDGIDITNNTIKVVKRLIVTDTMPSPSVDYVGEGKQRLFVGTTGTYTKGGIYECQEVIDGTSTTYEWVRISAEEIGMVTDTQYSDIQTLLS